MNLKKRTKTKFFILKAFLNNDLRNRWFCCDNALDFHLTKFPI